MKVNSILMAENRLQYLIKNVLLLVFMNLAISSPVFGDYKCIKPHLEIILIPSKIPEIHVFWQVENFNDGDRIRLYKHFSSPEVNPENIVGHIFVKQSTGIGDMKSLFVQKDMNGITDETHLGYTAIYWRNFNGEQKPLVKTSFKTNSTWMEHYWEILKDRPLNNIVIPGTHKSSSYKGIFRDTRNNMTPWKERAIVSRFAKRRVWNAVNSVNTHVITQLYNIYNQLMMGIRYLDIRPFEKGDGDYWTHHTGYVLIDMNTIIDDVVKFIKNTKKEIVILDVHEFYNAKRLLVTNSSKEKHYSDFIVWLKNKLQYEGTPLWAENSGNNSWVKTLKEISIDDRRVIVTHTDEDTQKHYQDFFWPSLIHVRVTSLKLTNYVKELQIKMKPNKAHVFTIGEKSNAAAAITSAIYKTDGVKEMMENNVETFHNLLRQNDIGKNANILASDYFLTTGVVRAAIIWNQRHSQTNDKDEFCDPSSFYTDDYYQLNVLPLELLQN